MFFLLPLNSNLLVDKFQSGLSACANNFIATAICIGKSLAGKFKIALCTCSMKIQIAKSEVVSS